MKICIFTHTFPRFKNDTAAPFMGGLANGMAESKNEIFVLMPYDPKFKKQSTSYKVITYKYIYPNFLHKIGFSKTLNNDMSFKPIVYFLAPFMMLFGTIALYKLVKKKDIDLINAHWILPNGFMAALVSFITKKSLVSTLPGSDVSVANKGILFKILAKIAFYQSKILTSNSPALIEDLTKIINYKNNKKTYFIPYGVDPKKFKPNLSDKLRLRKKYRIKEEEIIILAIGRLVEKKGFHFLLKSVPTILKKIKNVKFVFVGDGDQKQELLEITKSEKIEESVMFINQIDYQKLPSYYNLGDLFILPSIRDSSGNLDDQSVSVMEAMSSGLPIITTNFPGYKNVVQNQINGFLIPEKNTAKISEKIIFLVKNKQTRQKMGQKSREIIEKKFNWTIIANMYFKLFNSIHMTHE